MGYIGGLDAVDVGPTDVSTWIDQRYPLVFDLELRAHAHHSDLDDAVGPPG